MPRSRTLHLGVRFDRLLDVSRALRFIPSVEGDGWAAWGEALRSAENDGVTLHVTIDVGERHATGIVAVLAPFLSALPGSTVIAVETSTADWDVDAGGRLWHRIGRGAGEELLVVEIVQPSG